MPMTKESTTYYPLMSNAGLRPTYPVSAVNENGEIKVVEITGELPLTIFVDGREVVTLMTLGTHPEELALGYLRNQRLIQEIETVDGRTGDLLQGEIDQTNRHYGMRVGNDF